MYTKRMINNAGIKPFNKFESDVSLITLEAIIIPPSNNPRKENPILVIKNTFSSL